MDAWLVDEKGNEIYQSVIKKGAELFSDAEKKHPIDFNSMIADQGKINKYYMLLPAKKDGMRLGLSQSMIMDENGNVGLTIEILKDTPGALYASDGALR